MEVGVGRDVRIDVRDDSHDVLELSHERESSRNIFNGGRGCRGCTETKEQDDESTKLLLGK